MASRNSFLKNRYWVLRHGKSIPNENGLIVSSMENGTLKQYELASEGVHQARLAGELFLKAAQELSDKNIGVENVRICYSPFSRTCHTATIVASILDIPVEGYQFKAIEDLRERYFGPSYELLSHDKYPEIWALDEKDPLSRPEGGESVADVASRLTRALSIIESEFKGCAVLIVSHGDPLQILQTILNAARKHEGGDDLATVMQAVNIPSVLSGHRKYALQTGELRPLV